MAILQVDLVIDKPASISNASTNGGHRINTAIPVSAAENMFDHVFSTERAAGSTQVRFGYTCNHNTNQEVAQNVRIWIDNETAADDYVYMFARNQGDTNAQITGSEELFSVAPLKTNISAGATVLTMTFPTPSAADTYSRTLTGSMAGDKKIRITDKVYPDSVSGNTEFGTITGTPSVSGNDVTIALTTALVNAYTVAAGTRISKVLTVASISATFDTAGVTGAVTADTTTYPIDLENDAVIEETWTLTFLDATNFTCSGARKGAMAAGVTTTNYAPNNPDVSKPYFTINSAMWGGSPVAGNTFHFITRDSSVLIAFVRIVPVDAGIFNGNRCTVGITCESV